MLPALQAMGPERFGAVRRAPSVRQRPRVFARLSVGRAQNVQRERAQVRVEPIVHQGLLRVDTAVEQRPVRRDRQTFRRH